jgi:hypothetical protein
MDQINEQIEEVARRICAELGLDPDGQVMAGVLDVGTPKEIAEFGGYIPDVCLHVPRWETYRGKAALAIATEVAIRASFSPE